ncbi:MAG: DUF2283 domain-containing protein [Patescibacteria group bacterium]
MEIKYDPIAKAGYLKLKRGKISKTIKVKENLIIDLDKKGEVLGVELLDFSLPLSANKKSYAKVPVLIK